MEFLKKIIQLWMSLSLCLMSIQFCSAEIWDFNDPNVKVLNTSAGTLSLPKSNLSAGEFRWLIEPKEPKHSVTNINLFFTQLLIHKNDEVTIYKNLNDSYDDSKSLIHSPIKAQNGTISIITDEKTLVVRIKGNDIAYQRHFSCHYSSMDCIYLIPFPAEPTIIHSPIYIGKNSSVMCKFTYSNDLKHQEKPVFQFDFYNYTSNILELDGTTPGTYNKAIPMDFFPANGQHPMSITMTINNKNEYFRLMVHLVDKRCSNFMLLQDVNPHSISSPDYLLDNGTFGNECLWVIQHEKPDQVLGVAFTEVVLSNVLDIIAVNDGATSKSPPLFQVTVSNRNQSFNQIFRSSKPYMWISFKPINFNSQMKANITVHGQGGHMKGSGHLMVKETTGNDTIFTLEAADHEIVMLSFTNSDFRSPASLSIYDGFDTSNLIATLHGGLWYPILSQSNKMMLIATSFSAGHFEADFKGVPPGCMHTSTLNEGTYVLSGNCNNSCSWIIPPQNIPGSTLLLHIQYISLSGDDKVEIFQLDTSKTLIGSIDSTVQHIPKLSIPASIGALVQITRKTCSKPDDVVLVGHSSFIPACGGMLGLKSKDSVHISSPLFPDTYPLFSNCSWVLSAPKNSMIHLAFDKFSLAPTHCVKIFNSLNNVTSEYSGSELPDDIFIANGSVVQFNSGDCKKSQEPLHLTSSEGFTLEGTVAECGSILDKHSSGKLILNVTTLTDALCIWKIAVPSSSSGSVDIISYNISEKSKGGNVEVKVFDGASVREPQIVNSSYGVEIWSRKNSLIIFYKRENVSLPSSVFTFDYRTITCNSSMLCDNKMCMHPDWKCNGKNDCGDYSDEKNCDTVPPPPIINIHGYSVTTFWVTLFCMFGTGIVFGVVGPIVYEKYRNMRQYHQFGDISVIE